MITHPLRRAAPVLLALAALSALTACGTSGDTTSATTSRSAATEAPKAGGTLKLAVQNDPISIDPRAITLTDAVYIQRQVVDSLVDQDPKTGKIVPWLASSWTVNDDATTFTFTLRPGVTFSDGTPVDAAVVKANFDDLTANKAKVNPTILGALTGYASTKAVGHDRVVISFSTPNAPFLQALASPAFGLLSPATLRLPFAQRGDKVVGTGPFVLTSYVKNQAVTLTRRTGYRWAPPTRTNPGDAHLDKVVFSVVPESSVRTGSLTSGQLNATADVPPSDIPSLHSGGFGITARANPGIPYNLVPTSSTRAPLDDLDVRRAIAKAIDGKQVRDTVLSPEFPAATSALASTTPGYVDLGAQVAADPTEAARLLDAAGWKADGDHVRTKDGKPLSLTIAWMNDFSADQQVLELLKAQLAKVGVDAKLLEQTGAQLIAGLQKRSYDFFWDSETRADGDILTSFTDAAPNYYTITDRKVQPLLAKQRAVGDPATRAAVLGQIQRELIANVTTIPVFEQTTVVATAKNVHGLTLGAGSGLPQLTDVWIS